MTHASKSMAVAASYKLATESSVEGVRGRRNFSDPATRRQGDATEKGHLKININRIKTFLLLLVMVMNLHRAFSISRVQMCFTRGE